MADENMNDIHIEKRKQSFVEKAKDSFVMEDISTVWNETKNTVIKPGIRRIIASTLHTIINGIFLGEINDRGTSIGTSSSRSDGGRLISYNEFFGKTTTLSKERRDFQQGRLVRKDISSYKFETRDDADMTIEWMKRQIRTSEYGYLKVSEWYDHFHIKTEWTDNNFCWRDLSDARAMPNIDGGWYLLLPKPEQI